MRFYKKGYGGYALTTLVSLRHCNMDKLRQLLFGFGKYSNNTQIDGDILQDAFEIAKYRRERGDWADLISKYGKDIGVKFKKKLTK